MRSITLIVSFWSRIRPLAPAPLECWERSTLMAARGNSGISSLLAVAVAWTSLIQHSLPDHLSIQLNGRPSDLLKKYWCLSLGSSGRISSQSQYRLAMIDWQSSQTARKMRWRRLETGTCCGASMNRKRGYRTPPSNGVAFKRTAHFVLTRCMPL